MHRVIFKTNEYSRLLYTYDNFFLWGLIDGKEPSYGFTGFVASLIGTVVLAVIISANRIKNSRLVRELFG